MKIELRGYQERGLRNLRATFKKHKRVLAVSPTGSGKTVFAVAWLLQNKSKRVLWLAHSSELIDQAIDELEKYGVPAKDVGRFTGTEKRNTGARILVASVQMFHTRTVSSAVSDVDLIVIDEAHRAASGSYQTIVYSLPWAKVLGLTATPWRLDGQPLGDTFSAMVVLGQQTELIAEGFLSAPLTYGIPQEKAREMLRGVKGNGEYSQKQLSAAMRKPSLMGDIVEHWKKRADGQRTIVFAVNHEHARALTQRFADAGIKVAYLNTEILAHAERREALLRALKNDDIQVLVNVDALSEGFDCPSVKCIVLARPTKSLTRFLQQCGRGSRPFKGRRVVVLDHAGNCRRFGRPHEDREWSLVEGVTSSGSSKPLTKVCVNEDCLAEIPMGSVQCHECGADQPARARDLSESTGELVLLCASEQAKRKMEDDLRKLAKQKGLSEDWVKKAIRRAA